MRSTVWLSRIQPQVCFHRAAEILEKDIKDLKIITCHLGNGASVTAVKGGKSVDTSMGLTPVEGLIMGTRTGDLDLGVLIYIMQKEGIDSHNANTLINKHSGMLGITGISSDMREIENAAEKGNDRAILGLDMYHYRIRKYIGAYAAAMGGVDVIVLHRGRWREQSRKAGKRFSRISNTSGLNLTGKPMTECGGKETIITKAGIASHRHGGPDK